jgi:hypothetical protein
VTDAPATVHIATQNGCRGNVSCLDSIRSRSIKCDYSPVTVRWKCFALCFNKNAVIEVENNVEETAIAKAGEFVHM